MKQTTRIAAAAVISFFVPGVLVAQQQVPPPAVQEIMAEVMQIQEALQPIQEQALQDSAIQAQQEAVGESIRAAMIAADPTVGEALDRFEQILEEARAAQEAGDMGRIAELTAEARPLEPRIMQAQAQALQQPQIQQSVEAFQTELRTKMVELEPSAAGMLARLAELDERMRVLGGG